MQLTIQAVEVLNKIKQFPLPNGIKVINLAFVPDNMIDLDISVKFGPIKFGGTARGRIDTDLNAGGISFKLVELKVQGLSLKDLIVSLAKDIQIPGVTYSPQSGEFFYKIPYPFIKVTSITNTNNNLNIFVDVDVPAAMTYVKGLQSVP